MDMVWIFCFLRPSLSSTNMLRLVFWNQSTGYECTSIRICFDDDFLRCCLRYQVPHDPDTSYPIMADTITDTDLAILITVIPIGVFVLGLLCHKKLSDFHHALLTLMEGFALVTLFKRWMNLVGRYRPIYQALLLTNSTSQIEDGRQSYPSGHAAYMFLAMSITTLYLLGHLRVFAMPHRGNFALAFFCLAPVILATFVAVTRPANHRHHFSDINAGMCIGLFTGIFAYLLNFESILDPIRSGHPKFRTTFPPWVVKERNDRETEWKQRERGNDGESEGKDGGTGSATGTAVDSNHNGASSEDQGSAST